jgi:hypothetical protein
MTKDDLSEFAGLMAMLDMAFDKDASELRVEVYWQGLRQFDLEDVKRAVRRGIETASFYPKVAELRQMIQGDAESMAVLAWREVMRTIDRVGTYCSVAFADPVIHFAIENLEGWTAIGQWTKEDSPYRERDFIRLYEIGIKREITWRDVGEHLPGFIEMANKGTPGYDRFTPEIERAQCLYLTHQRRRELEAGSDRQELVEQSTRPEGQGGVK